MVNAGPDIEDAIAAAVHAVERTLSPSRERSLALTKLDEARFWASEAKGW